MAKETASTDRVELGHTSVTLSADSPSIIGTYLGTEEREGRGNQTGQQIQVAIFQTDEGKKSIRVNAILRDKLADAKPGMKLEIRFVGTVKTAKGDANQYQVFACK